MGEVTYVPIKIGRKIAGNCDCESQFPQLLTGNNYNVLCRYDLGLHVLRWMLLVKIPVNLPASCTSFFVLILPILSISFE